MNQKIIKETPDYIIMETRLNFNFDSMQPQDRRSVKNKQRKFLCIGGPHNGCKKAMVQLEDSKNPDVMGGYRSYNAADDHSNIRMVVRWRRGKQPYSAVYIHESLLK